MNAIVKCIKSLDVNGLYEIVKAKLTNTCRMCNNINRKVKNDGYCDYCSNLISWRNGKLYSNSDYDFAPKYGTILIAPKYDYPPYKYTPDLEHMITRFCKEKGIFLMKTKDLGELKVQLMKYDYSRGILYYKILNSEDTSEKQINLFNITSLVRLHRRQWRDGIKGYKFVKIDENGRLFSYNGANIAFYELNEVNIVGQEHDSFYNEDYVEHWMCPADDTPFRFFLNLEDAYSFYGRSIFKELKLGSTKLYHITAWKAYTITPNVNDWIAKKIKFDEEVKTEEIEEFLKLKKCNI